MVLVKSAYKLIFWKNVLVIHLPRFIMLAEAFNRQQKEQINVLKRAALKN